MKEKEKKSEDLELPEGCIAAILRRTTPLDIARISVVSKIFYSAADSDNIWDHFIPSEYRSIMSQSPSLSNALSKKTLYLALSDHPIIIDQGKKSFQLDRKSGKKGYMLAARGIYITRGDDERHCNWVTLPESRFEEVARLTAPCRCDILGKINTLSLSSNTQYTVFLVYKLTDVHGYPYSLVLLSLRTFEGPSRIKMGRLGLRFGEENLNNGLCAMECPKVRSDGFLELEMGEFFNSGLEDYEVEMTAKITDKNWGNGSFYLEGIEVRPKISSP